MNIFHFGLLRKAENHKAEFSKGWKSHKAEKLINKAGLIFHPFKFYGLMVSAFCDICLISFDLPYQDRIISLSIKVDFYLETCFYKFCNV